MSRRSTEPYGLKIARQYRFLLWRLPLLGATLVLTAQTAPFWSWWVALALPLIAGTLTVFLFRPQPLQRWCSRGWLMAADALLIAMALYGAASTRPLILAGFSVVVLLSVLIGQQAKTLMASGALLGLLFAGGVAGLLPAVGDLVVAVSYSAFLLAAAASFGALAERLVRREEARDAREESGEQWALLDITETIGSTLDLGQVMRSIVRQVGDLMNVESCSILLADEEQGGCFVIASKGHPEVDMLEVDLGRYPEVRRALETREPVVIKDVGSSPLVASVREVLVEKGYRALLVVPLLYGQEALGALFLRTRREDPFTPDEIRFCKLAAGASANALKNALLYRAVASEAEKHRVTGEKLRRVLDGTPDMIVATDNEGRVTEFNRGAEEITGRSADRAVGRRIAEILGAEFERDLQAAAPSGFHEIRYRRFDDEVLDISLASANLRNADGDVSGRVWIGRDVTQLRRVEKSLAQAERLSSLGEVVAGVAHELNNPLSGVVGYAELLRVHAPDAEQIRDLDRIVESAMRCQKIVLKLLSFARRHPPEKKSHDLNECVRKVLDLKSYHLRSSRIDTRLELDEDLPQTSFDFHQIEQVILNLLNNAEYAIGSMKAEGTVVLRTGFENDQVYLKVEDSGPGIPRAIRERIFDPFFTTKDFGQGTGLGLAVSYGIIREHGGRIDVDQGTRLGGACFTVYLPWIEGPADADADADAEQSVEQTGKRLRDRSILVVEDEPVVLDLLSRVLSDVGARVTRAHDGLEALDALGKEDYDLIVADLRMPNLDGRQLYETIAEERPDLLRRFVFSTGDLVREETVEFLEQLPNRILTKPLEVETVRRVLAQALDAAPR